MIEIKETRVEDLENVRRLWADGDVMRFVGFPDGLHKTHEEMLEWYRRLDSRRPGTEHYSVFEDGVYCGEAYYRIEKEHDNAAALDIKLFGFARGRGIATEALSFAVKEAFAHGAETVWVDPDPENLKAIALYERLGFKRAKMPEHLKRGDEWTESVYMELRKEGKR